MKILLLGCAENSAVRVALTRLGLDTICTDENNVNEILSEESDNLAAVYFSGEFVTRSEGCKNSAETLCKLCREREIPVIFDPDSKKITGEKERDDICGIAAVSEIFLPAVEDVKVLCGLDDPEKIADHFLGLGANKVVVTLDKKGAFYKSAKESGYAPTFRADKVVDTEGAGSAFAAGLISGITEEIPLSEAVIRANACGCIAIQSEGELDGLPTSDQLREYMLNHTFAVEGCKEF